MSGEKYIGLDVHQATISVAVVDSQGKLIMESILETKGLTLLEFFAGLRGSLFVTFEEGQIIHLTQITNFAKVPPCHNESIPSLSALPKSS